MPGARSARSLACSVKNTRVSHHGHTRKSPGIPRAMVLTVSFVLSPAIGLVCHRHQRSCLRRLDAGVEASGPHDFAVREKRSRLWRRPRPPHPASNVRDDRETPLVGTGPNRNIPASTPPSSVNSEIPKLVGVPGCGMPATAAWMSQQVARMRAR
jgi:hypothetical protein